jgi:hypothetical protein
MILCITGAKPTMNSTEFKTLLKTMRESPLTRAQCEKVTKEIEETLDLYWDNDSPSGTYAPGVSCDNRTPLNESIASYNHP